MKNNVAASMGSVALIEKVDGEYCFFQRLFGGIGGKAKNLISSCKLFMFNRLDECFSINQMVDGYSPLLFELLKYSKLPRDRTLYRDLVRIGKNYAFLHENYQQFIV